MSDEGDSRGQAIIGLLVSASIVIILGIGMAHFKVVQRVPANFTQIRLNADSALAKEMWNNQNLNNNTEATITRALYNHYQKLLRDYTRVQYTKPKTDVIYLLNMITTTGDPRENSARAWEAVAYFLPSVIIAAYCYTGASRVIRQFFKGLFDPSLESERYSMGYDPILEFGDTHDEYVNPTRYREKVTTGAPAEISPVIGHMPLKSAYQKEEIAPSVLFVLCLTIYIICGSVLLVLYKDYEFFTAFVSFVRFIAFIEPISVYNTLGGYLVLCACYGGQILFVCTLIEQAHGMEVCLGRIHKVDHDPLSIDDSYLVAKQRG